MAPGPALGFGGPCSAPLLAMPFPVGWEAKETGQGPGSPLIECSEYLGVLESPLGTLTTRSTPSGAQSCLRWNQLHGEKVHTLPCGLTLDLGDKTQTFLL